MKKKMPRALKPFERDLSGNRVKVTFKIDNGFGQINLRPFEEAMWGSPLTSGSYRQAVKSIAREHAWVCACRVNVYFPARPSTQILAPVFTAHPPNEYGLGRMDYDDACLRESRRSVLLARAKALSSRGGWESNEIRYWAFTEAELVKLIALVK